MKNILRFICVFTFILAATTHAGSIKKWVDADGNVSFGDAPPPSVTNSEKVKVQESYKPSAPSSTAPSSLPSSSPSSSPATDDYYSPQNQLKRMEEQKARERQARRERKADAAREELYEYQKKKAEYDAQRKDKLNSAACDVYTAKVEEHEHMMDGSRVSEAENLKNKTRLATLKNLQAHYCN